MSKLDFNLWPFFPSSSFECSLLCSVLLWHSAPLFCSALLLQYVLLLQFYNRQHPWLAVALMPSIPFSAVKWYFLFKRGGLQLTDTHLIISSSYLSWSCLSQLISSTCDFPMKIARLDIYATRVHDEGSFDMRFKQKWNQHSKAFKSKGIKWMLVSAWPSGWPGCTGREGAFALWASLTHGSSWMEIALSMLSVLISR